LQSAEFAQHALSLSEQHEAEVTFESDAATFGDGPSLSIVGTPFHFLMKTDSLQHKHMKCNDEKGHRGDVRAAKGEEKACFFVLHTEQLNAYHCITV
jgi:hypothetical protein